ncbi:MAG: hypothetical protein K0S08_590 [Gammaproteobacteria bacterium]|jgi:hypothetical protein|nr:hypothetical protein [Gammaproteobacteria bacterium]
MLNNKISQKIYSPVLVDPQQKIHVLNSFLSLILTNLIGVIMLRAIFIRFTWRFSNCKKMNSILQKKLLGEPLCRKKRSQRLLKQKSY